MKFADRGPPESPLYERAEKQTQALSLAVRREISLRGLKLVEVGRSLGVSGLYVSQVLRGNLDLRLIHVLDILQVLSVAPGAFFARLHPAGEGSEVGLVRTVLVRVLSELGVEPPPALVRAKPAAEPDGGGEAIDFSLPLQAPDRAASFEASQRISRALQLRMRGAGVWQRDLAQAVGLTESYLGKLVRGDKALKAKHFYASCGALEIEPGELLAELWPRPTGSAEARLDELVRLTVAALGRRGTFPA